MLTDLPTIRAEIRAKRKWRDSLNKQQARGRNRARCLHRIRQLRERIEQHKSSIVRLENRIGEERNKFNLSLRQRGAIVEQIGRVDREIVALRFLAGFVGNTEKRNTSASVERRGILAEHKRATLKWLVRLGEAIESGDEAAIDFMTTEFATAVVNDRQWVGTVVREMPYDKWVSACPINRKPNQAVVGV